MKHLHFCFPGSSYYETPESILLWNTQYYKKNWKYNSICSAHQFPVFAQRNITIVFMVLYYKNTPQYNSVRSGDQCVRFARKKFTFLIGQGVS